MATLVESNRFAIELRRWRSSRRWSQLELALRAGTTQRHLSFMEQGRSTPGRAMVVRLGESLELSLRERNALLLAAGYAPLFPRVTPRRRRARTRPGGPRPDPRRSPTLSGGDRQALWRAGRRPDPRLDEFLAELEGYVPAMSPGPDHLGFAVPVRLRCEEGELRLITTLTSFATATDITLAELQLEAFLPADDATAHILRARAQPQGPW